jgi:ABC-type Na+ efflux pump permease subunit
MYIKTIIMKELNASLLNKKYLLSIILNLLLGVGIAYGISSKITGLNSMNIALLECIFIGVPLFTAILSNISLVNEIFINEKLNKTFEAMLTTPLSLFKIIASKLLSSFILIYIVDLVSIFSMYMTWSLKLNGLISFPLEIWVMSLVIVPLVVMLYTTLSAYIALRFNYTHIIQLLNVPIIFIMAFLLKNPTDLLNRFVNKNIIDYKIIFFVGIFLIVSYTVLMFLIKIIKKESITI